MVSDMIEAKENTAITARNAVCPLPLKPASAHHHVLYNTLVLVPQEGDVGRCNVFPCSTTSAVIHQNDKSPPPPHTHPELHGCQPSFWRGGQLGGKGRETQATVELPGSPPVWSLFELLSGWDKQTSSIKTKASSVVP